MFDPMLNRVCNLFMSDNLHVNMCSLLLLKEIVAIRKRHSVCHNAHRTEVNAMIIIKRLPLIWLHSVIFVA